jgi:glucokinase
MDSATRYCVGIDFGGTNVKFCLLDHERRPSEILQFSTPEQRDDIIDQMICGARKLMDDHGVDRKDIPGVGVGSPGPIDFANGVLLGLPNVPSMRNVPLRDVLAERLDLPVVLENDANAAAYGEYICGAGKGAQDMVLLTLGTGIGSGIIIEGNILHGTHGIGAEFGHMVVERDGEQCGCGQRGCLERYCSATHMARRARRLIDEDDRSGLLVALLKQSGQITAKDIQEAVVAGDELAQEVWDTAVHYLAVACVNICRIFDPDEIVLAGGMTSAGEHLIDPLREHFEQMHWSITDILTKIDIATLGKDAGAIGAAGVAWSAFASK